MILIVINFFERVKFYFESIFFLQQIEYYSVEI